MALIRTFWNCIITHHLHLPPAHELAPTNSPIAPVASASKMLSRSVFRSSRAVSSRLSAQVASASLRAQSPLLRASVAPAAAVSPLRVASRWYSESAEPKNEEKKEEKKEGEEQKQELSEVDKLKEQIEAKNKEIVEMKVSIAFPFFEA